MKTYLLLLLGLIGILHSCDGCGVNHEGLQTKKQDLMAKKPKGNNLKGKKGPDKKNEVEGEKGKQTKLSNGDKSEENGQKPGGNNSEGKKEPKEFKEEKDEALENYNKAKVEAQAAYERAEAELKAWEENFNQAVREENEKMGKLKTDLIKAEAGYRKAAEGLEKAVEARREPGADFDKAAAAAEEAYEVREKAREKCDKLYKECQNQAGSKRFSEEEITKNQEEIAKLRAEAKAVYKKALFQAWEEYKKARADKGQN